MKFVDDIKKCIDLDFNENDFSVNHVDVDLANKTFYIDIEFKYVLNYTDYEKFAAGVNEYFHKLGIKSAIRVEYKTDALSSEEWIDYLKSILISLRADDLMFQALATSLISFDDTNDSLCIHLEEDAANCSYLLDKIKAAFDKRGLVKNVEIAYDVKRKLDDIQNETHSFEEERIQRQIDIQNVVKEKKDAITEINKTKGQYINEIKETKISEIPTTEGELLRYSTEVSSLDFFIKGEIFDKSLKETPRSKRMNLKIYDGSTSISVQKWCGRTNELELYNSLSVGDIITVFGTAIYSHFDRDVIIEAKKIEYVGKKVSEEVLDTASKKRVELHCHTKMTTLDGLTDVMDYVQTAKKWGHKALAITDLDGLLGIPDIAHSPVDENFMPIVGTELGFINDSEYFIVMDPMDYDLRESTYVVLDLETTGLSQSYDSIIEIAAYKVRGSEIVDTFESFVNPLRHISEKISELTTITDEVVASAPTIEEIFPKFLEFCNGCVLVAHNAKFDIGMIYRTMKNLNMEVKKFPAIDTLNGLRALHGTELKKFNLTVMSKFYKVKQEQHHRANDDTRVTAECFILMLQEFIKAGCKNVLDINKLIDKDNHYKYLFPNHITLLCKNQVGYKNLYKIISDALTVHCLNNGILLKSVLDKYREGLLVGSACSNGRVFECAMYYSDEELDKAIEYCDYIEVQPPLAYKHLFAELPNGIKDIEEIIIKIITRAKALNKIVVATSNCHYLRPELKKYRDILIATPQIGGGLSPLSKYKEAPDAHFRTTNEMLEEFSFLDPVLAMEIVVDNTNKIADMVERIQFFPKEMYVPADDEFKDSLHVDSIVGSMKEIVWDTCKKMYGDHPHKIVTERIERELKCIIGAGYSSVYYMSHLLVTKSNSDGYLVGSRGSVGSSLVATMMNITEINPLVPHYRCKKCKFHAFKMSEEMIEKYGITKEEEMLQGELQKVESGYDLNDAICPICGEKLAKDGQDIPFETFLGFNGDKVPDIDLNFSGEYQPQAHEYVRTLMGSEHAFRGGTTATIAENTAYGYVKAYCEKKNINLSSCEIDRMKTYLVGIRRSSGQHPGGIIVVPRRNDIYDVTPIQYPANNTENPWRTTHYDYHSFEDNLLKLDILGHDDPTIIKYLMDYVHTHQEEFPFDNAKDIPIDDKQVFQMFCSTSVVGLNEEEVNSKVASFAVPEFGTGFVRGMLIDTLPSTFAQLVKISGLSHGTDVWLGNAQDLVLGKTKFGKIGFDDIICCRDDIMIGLAQIPGFEPKKAFEIMEFVRKGKVAKSPDKWAPYKSYMEEHNVPEWYMWTCEKIKYLFPKAHATAYVMMALRIAWFKLHSPKLFYSAWFSKRAKIYSINEYIKGPDAIRNKINEINNKSRSEKTAKDEDMVTALEVALEMTLRGYKFLPVDIFKSDATIFLVEDEGIRCPFASMDGLGPNAAVDIAEKRAEKPFTSKKDVLKRTKLNQTLFEEFNRMHAFGDLPDDDPEKEVGLFAFM